MSIKVQSKFPSKGISGTLFMAVEVALMVLIFAAAQYFLAPSREVVETTFGKIPGWVGEYFARLGIIMLIVLARAYVIFQHVLDTPLTELRAKFGKSRNDSHAIILAGLMVLAAVLVVAVRGLSFQQYLYAVMTRGALGELVGDVLTVIVARFGFGIRSMDEFRDWVDAEDNDSHAILVVTVKVVTLAVALVS